MGEITYKVGGRIMNAREVLVAEKNKRLAKPKAAPSAPPSYHKGWVVEGFQQSELDAAKAAAEEAVRAWDALSDEARTAKLQSGARAPELWSEGRYVTTHKAKRVRSRPFEVASAAEDLKRIAERSGWSYVRVAELRKGQPEAGGL